MGKKYITIKDYMESKKEEFKKFKLKLPLSPDKKSKENQVIYIDGSSLIKVSFGEPKAGEEDEFITFETSLQTSDSTELQTHHKIHPDGRGNIFIDGQRNKGMDVTLAIYDERIETHQKDIKNIQEEINKLKKTNSELKEEVDNLHKDNSELKEEVYNDSNFHNSISRIQKIPVDIYLDTDDSLVIFEVYDSVLNFLESIEFKKAFEFEAKRGSWIKRMVAKSKTNLTNKEVTERLKEVEYAVEVNTILKTQSETDKNQSEAVLNILNSVENVPNAAIRIGSLIIVKVTSEKGEVNVQVRSLSVKELHVLNKKPELLHKPKQILNALTKAIIDDNGQNN